MTLAETLNKIKYYPDITKDTFVVLVVILVAFGAFLTGRYSIVEENRVGELRILETAQMGVPSVPGGADKALGGAYPAAASVEGSVTEKSTSGMYVGAKSGKTYYLPWCAGVKRIKKENKVWFSDEADARAKGYSPTASCKGM